MRRLWRQSAPHWCYTLLLTFVNADALMPPLVGPKQRCSWPFPPYPRTHSLPTCFLAPQAVVPVPLRCLATQPDATHHLPHVLTLTYLCTICGGPWHAGLGLLIFQLTAQCVNGTQVVLERRFFGGWSPGTRAVSQGHIKAAYGSVEGQTVKFDSHHNPHAHGNKNSWCFLLTPPHGGRTPA